MSGHDPKEDIEKVVTVSFIADLEASLVRALGQEKEYRGRCDDYQEHIESMDRHILDILQCKKIERYRELEIRFNKITTALKDAVVVLKHYAPPPPDHNCNADTSCDLMCDEYAKFEIQILEFETLLKGK